MKNVLIVLLLLLAGPASPATAATSAAGPKTHTLFMGTNVGVPYGKEICPVVDVEGSSFVISVAGKRVTVPMRGDALPLKVNDALKLSSKTATLAELKTERGYTPANDPERKFRAAAAAAMSASASVDAAGAEVASASAGMSSVQDAHTPPAAVAAAQQRLDSAYNAAADTGRQLSSDSNNAGYHAARLQSELAEGLYDAMNVSFIASSEKPLAHPYVLMVARYHERDSRPGTARLWIFAKAIDAVGGTPRTVHLLQGGFPPGFEIDEFHLHLFDGSEEVATNLARKRVPLTPEEAYEYIRIDYLAQNRGATVPATPALGELPPDFTERLVSERPPPVFVAVSADGHVLGVYADEGCSRKFEHPYFEAALKQVRFKPALKSGKPVEGVARIRLNNLSL